jgi:hypothetical protein
MCIKKAEISFPIRFKLQFQTAPFLHEAEEEEAVKSISYGARTNCG